MKPTVRADKLNVQIHDRGDGRPTIQMVDVSRGATKIGTHTLNCISCQGPNSLAATAVRAQSNAFACMHAPGSSSAVRLLFTFIASASATRPFVSTSWPASQRRRTRAAHARTLAPDAAAGVSYRIAIADFGWR
eukprot:6191719-Pleurochrysis_carterae.AAC.2